MSWRKALVQQVCWYGSQPTEELKSLQEENRRLKQMYADLALDNKIMRN